MELRGITFNSSLQTETSDYYRVLTPALERLVSSAGLGGKSLWRFRWVRLNCPHSAECGCREQEENRGFLNISRGLSCTSGAVSGP